MAADGALRAAIPASPVSPSTRGQAGAGSTSATSSPSATPPSFALGATAGLLIRRTLPAMAVTLAAFAGARLAMTAVRPHLIAPLRITVPDNVLAATSG